MLLYARDILELKAVTAKSLTAWQWQPANLQCKICMAVQMLLPARVQLRRMCGAPARESRLVPNAKWVKIQVATKSPMYKHCREYRLPDITTESRQLCEKAFQLISFMDATHLDTSDEKTDESAYEP